MSSMRRFFVLMGGLFGLIAAVQLWRLMSIPSDRWWTPLEEAPAAQEAADRVQILVRGERLEKAIGAGSLHLVRNGAAEPLTGEDVRLLLNDYDLERAKQFPAGVAFGIALGASLALLALGIAGLVPDRSAGALDSAGPGSPEGPP
jgi:hypothetical protein